MTIKNLSAIDSEKALLGACIMKSSIIQDVFADICIDDFVDPRHKVIAEYISTAEKFDLVTLTESLTAKQLLQQAGGTAYVSNLMDTCYSVSNADTYKDKIIEKSRLRKVFKLGQDLQADAMSDCGDEVLELAHQKILNMMTLGKERDYSSIGELLPGFVDDYSNSYLKKVSPFFSGIKALDEFIPELTKGGFFVLGARPGIGKTTLAQTISENYLLEKKGGVGLFSKEMSAYEMIFKYVSSQASVPYNALRDRTLSASDFTSMEGTIAEMKKWKLFIDDTPGQTVEKIRMKARKMVAEGVSLIIVDYLQLIKGSVKGATREQVVSGISQGLKNLARELKVSIIVPAQLSRASQYRTNKKPSLEDLRESGGIEADADAVILLWEPEKYLDLSLTGLIVAKNRHGKTGECMVKFKKWMSRFEDLSAHDIELKCGIDNEDKPKKFKE